MQRSLHIAVLGNAQSIHLKTRTRCFVERGHQVSLISPLPDAIPEVSISVIPQAWGSFKPGIPLYILRLARQLRQLKPDLVHIHYASAYELTAARLSGLPYIVTLMGSDILVKLAGARARSITGRLTCRGLAGAQILNPVSARIAARIAELMPQKKQILAAWGVSLIRFHPSNRNTARQSFGWTEQDFILLSPRLIKPLYNTLLIVEAFAEFQQHCPQARLVLLDYAADPAYRAQVIQLAAELALGDKLQILPFVPNEQMPDLYRAADLMVSMPASDGAPISLLEAMACGLPNILGRLSLYEDLVDDGKEALLCDFTAAALAATLLRCWQDATLRQSLAEQALARVRQQGDLAKDAARIEAAYYELCGVSPS